MPYGFTDEQWNKMAAGEKEGYVAATQKNIATPTTTTATAPKATTASVTTPAVNTASIVSPVTTGTTSTANDADKTLAKQIASGQISGSDADAAIKALAQSASKTQTGNAISTTVDPAVTALGNTTSLKQQTSDLVAQLLGQISNPTAYNSTTDTAYQTAKNELEDQASAAYDNTNSEYLGNQSGNFNSAAQQIASSAKNDLLDNIPALQQTYEDRYNTQQQQQTANTTSLINTLLGLQDRETAAEEKKVSDYVSTIGQYSDNYKAEINRIEANVAKGDTSEQWKLDHLNTARQDKIANLAAAQTAAEEKAAAAKTAAETTAYNNAYNAWKTSGTITTQTQADLIGLPVGSKTNEYDMDRINAAIAQQNANTSAKNASTAAANANKSNEGDADYNAWYKSMMSSTDPAKYLEANKAAMKPDTYTKLKKLTPGSTDLKPYQGRLDSMISATIDVPIYSLDKNGNKMMMGGEPIIKGTSKQAKYTDQQLIDYINGLKLSQEDKNWLANYAGLPE